MALSTFIAALLGSPGIKASGSVIGSTAAATAVCSFTPSQNGLYRLSGWVDCTAFTSGTVGITATWTDPNNVAHTAVPVVGINAQSGAGPSLNLAGVGQLMCITMSIWVKGGTALSMSSAISATATGDFLAAIEQII